MEIKPKTPFTGTVKEYTQENYICEEHGEEVLDSTYVFKYNQDHLISEICLYDANNQLSEISNYTYNDDQSLKEVQVRVAEGEMKRKLIYEYKDNKLDQITEIAGDYKAITKYDNLGNPLEKHNITNEDVVISKTQYINLYDQESRLVEKHTIFPSGESDWVEKYAYNESGLPAREEKIRHQMTSVAEHHYNEKGDLILSDFNAGMSNYEMLKREIVYDRNDDILEIQEYRKGWCYQDRNDEFGLTGIIKYSYVR
jgi:hypothetical protein